MKIAHIAKNDQNEQFSSKILNASKMFESCSPRLLKVFWYPSHCATTIRSDQKKFWQKKRTQQFLSASKVLWKKNPAQKMCKIIIPNLPSVRQIRF